MAGQQEVTAEDYEAIFGAEPLDEAKVAELITKANQLVEEGGEFFGGDEAKVQVATLAEAKATFAVHFHRCPRCQEVKRETFENCAQSVLCQTHSELDQHFPEQDILYCNGCVDSVIDEVMQEMKERNIVPHDDEDESACLKCLADGHLPAAD